MKDIKIRKLVITAVMMALVCVATMIIQIPSPAQGYVNLGDCFVLLGAWLLGPWYGAAAAGLGSMITDLLMGYAFYAPASLIIKGLDALVAGLIFKKLADNKGKLIISGVCGELIMVIGYFLYAALLMQNGWSALLSIPGDLFQAFVGILLGIILMTIVHKTKMDRYFS